MGKYCVRVPKRRNGNNELVPSKLFEDLLTYSSNDRAFAKRLYALTKDSKFMDVYGSQMEFDENDEPTLQSLLRVAKESIEEDKILKVLDKELGAGTYDDWQEALAKIERFNAIEHSGYTEEGKEILRTAKRDSQGRLLSPKGVPTELTETQYVQVRTKAFKKWFGDWEKLLKHSIFSQTWGTYGGVTVSEQQFYPDMAPDGGVRVIKVDGKYIGEIPTVEDEKKITMSGSIGAATEIEKEYRGKGYGKKAHVALALIAAREGKVLHSDSSNSDAEDALWQSLIKDGYAEVIATKPKTGNWNHTTYRIINENLPKGGEVHTQDEEVSKVINPRTGEPLVVYHGTSAPAAFSKFSHWYTSADDGFYFTSSRKYAELYNEKGVPLFAGFLNIRNPKVLKDIIHTTVEEAFRTEEPIDGVIGQDRRTEEFNRDLGEEHTEYVVMRDSQVQTAADNTTWSTVRKDTRYMATVTPTENGKYKVSATRRTQAAENQLHDTIVGQTVQDKLIALLKKHGVAVDFLTDSKQGSRYSTENAVRSADGLYHLILIAQGKTDATPDVAEEAGHWVIASLGDSPLVKRLINYLSPEVQKEALGEEYASKYLGRDARREVAGDLVGKALLKRMNNDALGNLVNRIVDLAKRIYYKFSANEVAVMRVDAERLADRIAKNFLSDRFEGTMENALDTEETLYSAEYSHDVKVYKNMINELRVLSAKLRAANSAWADRIDVVIAKMQIDREQNINQNVGALADYAAIEGVAQGMDMLLDIMSEELPNLLNSVDFSNTYDFATNMARNGKSLREAHLITKACAEISILLANSLKGISPQVIDYIDPITKEKTHVDIGVIQANLAKFTDSQQAGSFYHQLLDKEKQFFLKFLSDSYGQDYINRSTRVVFDRKLAQEQGKWFIAVRKGRQQPLEELVESLESDINFFDKFLGAMADSGDVIGEIVDKTMKQANKDADDMTNRIWDDLRAIEQRAKAAGVKDPQVIYERDPKTGKLTGNLIDRLYWGLWERDYQEYMQQCKEEFLEQHENDPDFINRSELEKTLAWQAYYEPLRKAWHHKHSTNHGTEGWMPSEAEYRNYEYDNLSDEAKTLLNEIMDLKKTLDSMVGHGMPIHRAPQFKGTFMNSIRNKGSRLNPKSYGSVIWDNIKDAYTIDENDAAMYGSTLTYNEPQEDMFANQIAFEKEKINRIPLFGINRLKNMDMLSTDIYSSMVAYAGMAIHYAAVNQVVDTVEIGKEVLRNRKVAGNKKEVDRDKTSWAFTRYCKYLDKQIYGVGQKPIVIGKVVLNKITSAMSGLASKLFLGGNLPGGLVNLGTGKVEIFKEAVAGENFSLKDLQAAKLYYYRYAPKGILQMGKSLKDDELSLIIRHFNILGNNQEMQRMYSTYRSRAKFIFDEALLFPYTAGDHYMQSMSYLSLLHKQQLIGEDGTTTNALDLYNKAAKNAIEYTDSAGYTSKSQEYGKTLTLDGVYFKSEEDRQTYLLLKSIIETINNAPTSGLFGGAGKVITYSQEQLDYLQSTGWQIDNPEHVIALAQKEMRDIQWNSDDESALMDRAREVNNRLHGIYNAQDKTETHQHILGAMLLALRGYALGMAQRRFGKSKYSVVLGGETEGSMLTVTKMIAAMGMENWGWGTALGTFLWPWSKNAKAKMEAAGFSSNQYANLRRTAMDFIGIVLLTLVRALCAQPDDDDKNKEDIEAIKRWMKENGFSKEEIDAYTAQMKEASEIDGMGVVYYFASRLLREQSAYNWGLAMYDEWANITSLVPAGASALYSLGELAYFWGGAQMFQYEQIDPQKYEYMKELGFSKDEIAAMKRQDQQALKDSFGKRFYYQGSGPDGIYKKGDPKYERKFNMMMPYWNYIGRTQNVLYHPYQAAKSFEYGRQVR